MESDKFNTDLNEATNFNDSVLGVSLTYPLGLVSSRRACVTLGEYTGRRTEPAAWHRGGCGELVHVCTQGGRLGHKTSLLLFI